MPELTTEEKHALDELFARVYGKVRQLASRVRWNGEHPTLNPTALVHEAYLKLVKSQPSVSLQSYEDVIGIFATAMRQILIDAARRKKAQKRAPVPAFGGTALPVEDALTLAGLMESLYLEDPRQARIVDCRFYLGMTVEETATALGLSTASVEREWRDVKTNLNHKLRQKGAAV